MPLPDEIEALFSGETPSIILETLFRYIEESQNIIGATFLRQENTERKLDRLLAEIGGLHRKFEDMRMAFSMIGLRQEGLDSVSNPVVDFESIRAAVRDSVDRTRRREFQENITAGNLYYKGDIIK